MLRPAARSRLVFARRIPLAAVTLSAGTAPCFGEGAGKKGHLVAGSLEASRGVVDGAAEARTNGQQPADQARDEVLAGPRRHDGVVRACRTSQPE